MSRNEEDQLPKGVPPIIGEICASLAGGMIGWHAADRIAPFPPQHVVPLTPEEEEITLRNFLADEPLYKGTAHAGEGAMGLDDVLSLAAHLGFASLGIVAGNTLGKRNDAKGTLVFGGLLGAHVAAEALNGKLADLQSAVHDVKASLGSSAASAGDGDPTSSASLSVRKLSETSTAIGSESTTLSMNDPDGQLDTPLATGDDLSLSTSSVDLGDSGSGVMDWEPSTAS